MKKIIVTGCNGQLGRAINQELAGNTEVSIVNTDVAELDITSVDEVLALVREVKPYAIINCAAHTAVDACETDLDNAYRINAIGPRNLGIAATETGAKLIHVSTDYAKSPGGLWKDQAGRRKHGKGFCGQIHDLPYCMAVWRWQEFCKDYAEAC